VAVLAYRTRSATRHRVLAALVLYAGAVLVTMGISVPLNEQLAAVDPVASIADPAPIRGAYENTWGAPEHHPPRPGHRRPGPVHNAVAGGETCFAPSPEVASGAGASASPCSLFAFVEFALRLRRRVEH
jgi:hypothetical protein